MNPSQKRWEYLKGDTAKASHSLSKGKVNKNAKPTARADTACMPFFHIFVLFRPSLMPKCHLLVTL